MNYVWYASYGSNISNERFLCYILGGRAKGAQTSEEGCKDSTLPIKYENITIPRMQYYSKSSYRWQNQGVAFIDSKYSEHYTYGRMYLVTEDQFSDVVKQENRMKVNETLDLKLEEARHQGSATVVEGSWYGRILFLGERDGYPIYTFTNIEDYKQDVSKPSKEYIQMIGSGLFENYHFTLNELSQYFSEKPGIKNMYTLDELKDILSFLYKEI